MQRPDPFLADEDNPALTDDQLASMKPASAVFTPEQLAVLSGNRRPGRPLTRSRKIAVKLRIDPETLAAFKASGPGWQTRMNEALRRAVTSKGQ